MVKNTSFYFLLIGQAATSLGDVLYLLAIITFIYQNTGTATAAALVPLIRVIANLTGGAVVPLLLDRVKLLKLLVASQTIQFFILLMLVMSYAIFTNSKISTAILLVFVFMLSFFDGWTFPARSALLPSIVQESQLVQANSWISSTEQTLGLLGWSFGGVLVAKFGDERVLVGTLVLFMVSTLLLFRISIPGYKQDLHKREGLPLKSKWNSLKEGWVSIWQTPILRTVLYMDIFDGLAGAVWIGAITLVYVKQVLHQGNDWWGYINGSYYLGSILGGILVLTLSRYIQSRLIESMLIGSFVFGTMTLVFGYSTVPLVSLILCLCMGPFYELRTVARRSVIQKYSSADLLSKIFAAKNMVVNLTFSLSVLLMGLISDHLGIQKVYLISSLLLLLSVVVGFKRVVTTRA